MVRLAAFNLAAIALACAAAHAAPTETLLGAYAFAGPAHFIIEAAWLHDHGHFRRGTRTVLPAIAAAGAATAWLHTPLAVCCAFAAAIGTVLADLAGLGLWSSVAAGAVSGGGLYEAVRSGSSMPLAAAALFPTIAHVVVFTASFVLKGAGQRDTAISWAAPAAFTAAALTFVGLPCSPMTHTEWTADAVRAFGWAVQCVSPSASNDIRPGLVGFLGFAYLFHSLHFLARAEGLGWNAMTGRKAAAMTVAWGGITAAYLCSFAAGFALTLPLAVAHVMLELPLQSEETAGARTRWVIRRVQAAG